jgi:hypothetical protein
VLVAAASVLAGPGAAAPSADVEITLVITGTLGMNGWYTSNVTVNWVVTGAANSSGCDAKTLTADTSGVTLTCSASNLDGTSTASKSRAFKIDKTAPVVTATPAHLRLNGGQHPPAVIFFGTDATSASARARRPGLQRSRDEWALPFRSLRTYWNTRASPERHASPAARLSARPAITSAGLARPSADTFDPGHATPARAQRP